MNAAPPAHPLSRAARARGAFRRLGPRLVAAGFWFVLPALCLVGLALGVDRFARHVNHVPPGAKGEYYVTSRSCQQQLCITSGTFTSDDKKVVEHDLLGDYRWRLGNGYRVVYNANAADVVPLAARWDPTSTIVGVGAAGGMLAIWVWCLHGELRARGRRRAAQPVD